MCILRLSVKVTNLLPKNKERLSKNGVFLNSLLRYTKKTVRAFFAETYRSVKGAGDSCKATLWHIQTIRLVLLRSRPDTVHGIVLHKTLLSTFLTPCRPPISVVEKGVQL